MATAGNDKKIVWGIGTPRTLRAHWTMHELGLEYECRRIGSRDGGNVTPEYTRLNPSQKIPTVQDGELVVSRVPRRVHGLRREALNERSRATELGARAFVLAELRHANSDHRHAPHGGSSPVKVDAFHHTGRVLRIQNDMLA